MRTSKIVGGIIFLIILALVPALAVFFIQRNHNATAQSVHTHRTTNEASSSHQNPTSSSPLTTLLNDASSSPLTTLLFERATSTQANDASSSPLTTLLFDRTASTQNPKVKRNVEVPERRRNRRTIQNGKSEVNIHPIYSEKNDEQPAVASSSSTDYPRQDENVAVTAANNQNSNNNTVVPNWFYSSLASRLERTILVVKDVPENFAKKVETFQLRIPNHHHTEKIFVRVVARNTFNGNNNINLHVSFWKVEPNSISAMFGKKDYPSEETNNREVSFYALKAVLDRLRRHKEEAAVSNGSNYNHDQQDHDLLDFISVACNELVGELNYNSPRHYKRNVADNNDNSNKDNGNATENADNSNENTDNSNENTDNSNENTDNSNGNNGNSNGDNSQSNNQAEGKERSKRAVFYPVRPGYGVGYIGVRPVIAQPYYPVAPVVGGFGYQPAVIGGIGIPYGGYHHRYGRSVDEAKQPSQ